MKINRFLKSVFIRQRINKIDYLSYNIELMELNMYLISFELFVLIASLFLYHESKEQSTIFLLIGSFIIILFFLYIRYLIDNKYFKIAGGSCE